MKQSPINTKTDTPLQQQQKYNNRQEKHFSCYLKEASPWENHKMDVSGAL
jgi:hypothetical protein